MEKERFRMLRLQSRACFIDAMLCVFTSNVIQHRGITQDFSTTVTVGLVHSVDYSLDLFSFRLISG
jgi:hypothetical protein